MTQVAPGAIHIVEIEWRPQITFVFTEPYHNCLRAVISSPEDPTEFYGSGPGAENGHVHSLVNAAPVLALQQGIGGPSNNDAQQNVDFPPPGNGSLRLAGAGAVVSTTFNVGNPYAGEQLADVLVDATDVPADCEVRLDLGGLFDRWKRFGQDSLTGATVVSGSTQLELPGGGQAVISGLPLAAEELVEVVMEVSGLNGRYGWIDVSEHIGGQEMGGVSLHVVGRQVPDVFLPLVLRDFSP